MPDCYDPVLSRRKLAVWIERPEAGREKEGVGKTEAGERPVLEGSASPAMPLPESAAEIACKENG